MKTHTGRRYVGAVANRDPELMAELRSQFGSFGVETVELPPDERFEATQLANHGVDLVLVKLNSYRSNSRILTELRKGHFSFLNTLRSVKLCQSRRAMFAFAKSHLPELKTPRMFSRPEDARRAIELGELVWVRRDAHNIPISERVLGVAASPGDLEELIGDRDPYTLFFQEYLGTTSETYKIYVIGGSIVGLRRSGRQNGVEPDRDVRVERVELTTPVVDAVRRIGSTFGMAVYGVDLLYREGETTFLDFNDFPSFRGIREASHDIWEFAASRYLPCSLVPPGAKSIDRPE